jgi:probable rRNA maturation factor
MHVGEKPGAGTEPERMDDDGPPPAELHPCAAVAEWAVSGVNFDVIDATGSLGARLVEWLAARSRDAAGVLGAAGEVRVRLVGDEEMSRAHERYSGIAGTTDVLTFNLAPPPTPTERAGGGELDTDLLVCVDEARRQAAVRGIAVEREVLLYIVHGVLHCLGYDDHTEEGGEAMHRREDEVLGAIGVGATFGLPPSHGEGGGA